MTIFTFPNLIAGLVIAQAIQLFYIITYRLFLSPLAGIPGPQLAAVTSWYEVYYDVWKPAQYVFKIKELHERYGECKQFGHLPLASNAVHKDPSFA